MLTHSFRTYCPLTYSCTSQEEKNILLSWARRFVPFHITSRYRFDIRSLSKLINSQYSKIRYQTDLKWYCPRIQPEITTIMSHFRYRFEINYGLYTYSVPLAAKSYLAWPHPLSAAWVFLPCNRWTRIRPRHQKYWLNNLPLSLQSHPCKQSGFNSLALEGLYVILKMSFSILFYWLVSSHLMIMSSDGCHRT